jgi:hypothetical protein
MHFSFKAGRPIFIAFLVLTTLVLAGNVFFSGKGIDFIVLMAGNCLFFLISLFVFRMQWLAMYNSNPNVFIRSVMGSMLIKLFACVIAVVAYYFITGSAFNKPAVYISMLIYVVYLVVEVRTIMKLNKSKNA